MTNLTEHYASQEPPPHMCFTTDGKWVACPADLCEAFYLVQENVSLSRQLERVKEALRLIGEHARLDYSERGIAEAERYALLAEDALTHQRASK